MLLCKSINSRHQRIYFYSTLFSVKKNYSTRKLFIISFSFTRGKKSDQTICFALMKTRGWTRVMYANGDAAWGNSISRQTQISLSLFSSCATLINRQLSRESRAFFFSFIISSLLSRYRIEKVWFWFKWEKRELFFF